MPNECSNHIFYLEFKNNNKGFNIHSLIHNNKCEKC